MLAVLFRPFGCIAPKHFKLFSFPILRFITSPDEGYYSNVPDEDYYSNVPDEGYYNNVPDEGYYSNASCVLNLISTGRFLYIKHIII